MLPQVIADGEAKSHLAGELVALHQSGVFLSGEFLFELEIIVPEPDGAHPRHADHCDQDVTVVEPRPEDGAGERCSENDESAHRRGPSLLLMRVRGPFSDDLMETHAAEAAHDSRS